VCDYEEQEQGICEVTEKLYQNPILKTSLHWRARGEDGARKIVQLIDLT